MTSGQERTAASKNDKRGSILQAAWGLIRHYGYNKTTVDDIAKSANVGKGTIYLYFRSKADIMLALTDLTNERITNDLEKIADGEGTPTERLRRCVLHRIMTLFDLVNKYPHSEDVIASMLPAIVQRLDRYVRRHGELLAKIIEDGRASGELQVDDPASTGLLMAGLYEHLTPPYYRFRSRKSLERFANQTMDLLLVGLSTRPAKDERRDR
jgi:AcrR family transcriptional regulator